MFPVPVRLARDPDIGVLEPLLRGRATADAVEGLLLYLPFVVFVFPVAFHVPLLALTWRFEQLLIDHAELDTPPTPLVWTRLRPNEA